VRRPLSPRVRDRLPGIARIVSRLDDTEAHMVKLFEKVSLRGLELKNRIVVSPMGMYSAENGCVTPFHLVHYGKFAMGGTGSE
jgi:hypothetical protein